MPRKLKLKSTSIFEKSIAKRFAKVDYFKAESKNQKMTEYIESEKNRLSTSKWEVITDLIAHYKVMAETEVSQTGKILLGIYNKNREAAGLNKRPSTRNSYR
jgi:hypothetical protein